MPGHSQETLLGNLAVANLLWAIALPCRRINVHLNDWVYSVRYTLTFRKSCLEVPQQKSLSFQHKQFRKGLFPN
jgi:hypothetical protein